MNISSFFINDRKVSHLEINGRLVMLRHEPAQCDALCFTAQEPGSTVKVIRIKAAPNVNLQTSTDGNSWNPYTVEDVITLANVDDKVYFKAVGSNSAMTTSQSDYNKFVMTGKIAASGNVNSLLEEDEQTARTISLSSKTYCYYNMFTGCKSLTKAPELPATTLDEHCYQNMFTGCTSLTQAPELPATTLAKGCYQSMFSGCTSLTTAPELPATTLADGCYFSMFQGCTSLTQAPALTATALAISCYRQMFQSCSSLTTAPELPATTLANYCYADMFSKCTSLTQAPALPATTLAGNCYDRMFNGCTSLTQAPELPTTTLAKGCYQSMFSGCTSLTTAPELPATTLAGNCYNSMFNGCTSLTQAPALPAMTLADYCYSNMFYKCTSLTQAPVLPATTLANNCYYSMFNGCTSLTQAPALPATTLADNCYNRMFSSCTSFTQAPELPATTLASNCYKEMFYGCSSLTQAPELPATTLASYCYSNMFRNCTSLRSAPSLLATTLAVYCYSSMFEGCSSLTQAPELPATTLASSCYQTMFKNCSNLNTITLGYTGNFSDAPSNAFTNWVQGVASTGTFYYNGTDTTTGTSAIPSGWTVVKPSQEPSALCFTAEEPGSTVKITKNGSAPNVNLQTSTDGNSWTPYAVENTITLANVGDKVYFKAVGSNRVMGDTSNYNKFVMTGKIAASGNVNSLLEEDEETARTMSLAGKGPCYYGMFKGCTSLTQAPELPSTTLDEYCYNSMFYGCSSLTQAPSLPATTLTDYCYYEMFGSCSSLTQAPKLPATTLADNCYNSMFNGCTSLTQAPALPATTLAYGCYKSMFSGCTSLTTAPELPATTLTDYCYYHMFSGCSSLTQAPELPATTLANNCYPSMFTGCTSLTQSPELPATTLANYCYDNMFNGCTSLTQAPELPATTLADGCYQAMFYRCSNLNTIKLGYTGNFANDPSNAFGSWVDGVSSTGTFYYNGSDKTTGVNAIPSGWVVVAPLCFTAQEANSTLHLDKVGTPDAISIETSTDGNTWSDYSWTNNTGDTLTLSNVGDKVYMRAKNENQTIGSSTLNYYKFVMTGKIASSGNIQALLKADCSRTDSPANCYYGMFSGCKSLTTAPELPATTLANDCYSNMFNGCTSLTTAPELPATTLANYCYSSMFRNCSALTTAPRLPATTLANYCYELMFRDCSNLNTITLFYTGNFANAPSNAFNNWVQGVASTGTFYYNGTDTTTGTNAIPSGWTVLQIPRPELCFTAEEDNSTLRLDKVGTPDAISIETSTDGNTWTDYSWTNNTGDTLTLSNVGDKVYMRAKNENQTIGIMPWIHYQFVMTGKIAASGNIQTLLKADGSRTDAPADCYYGMFEGCSSLTKAPELPATTLDIECYMNMFNNCTNLNYVKVGFTNWDTPDATNDWLPENTGTFECPQELIDNTSERTTNTVPSSWTMTAV